MMQHTTEHYDVEELQGQPNGDGGENNGKAPKRQKSRHRASVACATCRERRIRVGDALRHLAATEVH